MLNEIICDKFNTKNQKISFHQGLNVVLGNETGTNSIGKSTFLMIIDFVFGGDDYIDKCLDVHRNVDFHQIKFAFSFDGEIYKFVRDTKNSNLVLRCSNDYSIQQEISIDEYRVFLKEKYRITNEDLSFRETVSGYYRIYQRKNYNEYRPFQFFYGEAGEKSVLRLLKLYNLYSSIKKYEALVKENLEKLSIYNKSIKQGFIPKINKREYELDKKEIEKTNMELSSIASDLDRDTLDIENLRTAETRTIKDELSIIRSKLAKYENKRNRLQSELAENISPTISDKDFYESLKSFFPNVDTKSLSEVDAFHKGLFQILNSEVKQEIAELDILVNSCNKEISDLLKQLDLYQNEKELSKVLLSKIENVVSHKKELIAETDSYDKLKSLKDSKKQSVERLEQEIGTVLIQLQNRINVELVNINSKIYATKHQAPVLNLKQKNYDYSSVDDNGTGTNYKNLIILDLCLLRQTCLPCIIHDSLLFKNIGDEPLENIFVQYTTFSKQIFIAFDRLSTYSEKIQTIVENNKVLRLGDDSEALFGFTWGTKK